MAVLKKMAASKARLPWRGKNSVREAHRRVALSEWRAGDVFGLMTMPVIQGPPTIGQT